VRGGESSGLVWYELFEFSDAYMFVVDAINPLFMMKMRCETT